ncbi:MAG: sugar ABC transporter ATP-binding protein [Rhodobacterales bacterium 32-67-9]|nr:MAG: sugar ABC transporter ATP-binding protein [Rhodobacterales bacterium 32-67-9]
MATVEYRRIGKSYGAVEVLKELDLTVEDGTFVVLLGASGCGKTTLLRMTAGLETISAGELSIDGKVVNTVHPRDRDVAMVFQNYALYPTMTVRENIGFSLEVAKKSKAEVAEMVENAARVLNLTEYLDRKPAALSGGQRQRVAMGRAMVRNAKVFLFDEPLSNLDAKLRAHMRVEIRQLHNRLGATTIYVTHDQIEAMTMADRIVLMKDGSIVQEGSPDDLYDRPNSLFVAEFIGTPQINSLEGRIVDDGGSPAFETGGIHVALPAGYGAHTGRRVICGIRPSDVTLDPDGPLRGTMSIAEKTGADVQFYVDIDGREFVAVAPRASYVSAGTTLAFAVAPEKLHMFDAETGRRIEL